LWTGKVTDSKIGNRIAFTETIYKYLGELNIDCKSCSPQVDQSAT